MSMSNIVADRDGDEVSKLRFEEFKTMDVKQKGMEHANISFLFFL